MSRSQAQRRSPLNCVFRFCAVIAGSEPALETAAKASFATCKTTEGQKKHRGVQHSLHLQEPFSNGLATGWRTANIVHVVVHLSCRSTRLCAFDTHVTQVFDGVRLMLHNIEKNRKVSSHSAFNSRRAFKASTSSECRISCMSIYLRSKYGAKIVSH